MNHEIKHTNSNIVIAADNFNVTALDPVWLYQNGIFLEEENNKKTSISMMTQIVNDDFKFDLLPDRLQFSINPAYKSSKSLINQKIKKLIKLIKDTNFIAVGLNFIHHVFPANGNLNSLTRNLFFNENSNFFPDLTDDDIQFGFQYSKNEIGTRLKFEAKQQPIVKNKAIVNVLQLSYNYNINIDPNASKENNLIKMIELLDKWNAAKKLSNELSNRINLKD